VDWQPRVGGNTYFLLLDDLNNGVLDFWNARYQLANPEGGQLHLQGTPPNDDPPWGYIFFSKYWP
jgi:hypothetical protein